MLKQRDNIKLLDVIECINRIELFIVNMDFAKFIEDIKTQDAVIRNLEIIGEEVKSISEDFKKTTFSYNLE